jgi:uncharacterized protein HemY
MKYKIEIDVFALLFTIILFVVVIKFIIWLVRL